VHPFFNGVEVSAHVLGAKLWHWDWHASLLGWDESDGSKVCFAHDELTDGVDAMFWNALVHGFKDKGKQE
jgi:hypothetical protein